MMQNILPLVILFSGLFLLANAQQDKTKGWHLLDEKIDSFYGISLNKAYEFLKNRPAKTVIVAVIDGGIDTTHEDLKNILWTNPKEIPGNGIDDDGNGYIDDVHGWNFLGNKNGNNLKDGGEEITRVFYRYKDKFSKPDLQNDTLTAEDKQAYKLWEKAANKINAVKLSDQQAEVAFWESTLKSLKKADSILQNSLHKKSYTGEDLEQFMPTEMNEKKAKLIFISLLKMADAGSSMESAQLVNELSEFTESKRKALDARMNPPVDARPEIIHDDYNNINDRFYGNNDIMGPSPLHGTHVSGIIAAQRNNDIGIDGVADHVQLMMIRAVPDGDEYDKDVALAIRYAVDNGAKVINMSFGKTLSPEKKWVDEAVHYAELKDVLIIHAAGNDAVNADSVAYYPNANLKTINSRATNMITVGASADPRINNGKLIADFSNYGAGTVDVFAPGVKIYSTIPGGNTYGFLQGTSMSAPVVTGIAALIR
ncbi:MAG: S8 family serine peptidase, partial [Chitinophagaceae bacterium]|nr:S8 family serine peptidase [Chitinophagaceae bacterium]